MRIIVGLGNPGEKYALTRHNIGFMLLDHFAKHQQCEFRNRTELKSWIAEGLWKEEKLLLVKPATYMNLSGEAVSKVLHFYKKSPTDLIFIYDDLALPLGKIRIRPAGSAGGHNGIKSVLEHLKTETFLRLRMGIGPLPLQISQADFVLGRFTSQESQELPKIIDLGSDALQFLLSGNTVEAAMSKYNG